MAAAAAAAGARAAKAPAVRVGLGVLCERVDAGGLRRVLVGQRKGSAGAGQWALPGGHLEFGETWAECAGREVLEECGFALQGIRQAGVINCMRPEQGYHYVVIFMRGTVPAGVEPRNMEPDKCEGWEWCTWDEVARKQPLFRSLEMFIEDGMHLSI